MADIILKEASGMPVTYPGVETIELRTSDGGTQIYSEGTVAENLGPIELNFTDGDQTIYAPEGILVKSAIIQKPKNLKPENIIKDVKIAGIIGTGEGGSGSSDEIDIFPSQPVEGFAPSEDFNGAYAVNSPISFTLNLGETYYVEWDGETYTCQAKSGTFFGMDIMYMGNDTLLGGTSDEPFTVGYFVDVGVVGFISDDNEATHTVRIYQKAQSVIVAPLTVTENGTYTAPEGKAYSPVTVDVVSSVTTGLPLGYELKEILSERPLTFAKGNSTTLPNTPAVVLADKTAIANMEIINDGESGLVIWDGKLYAAYAGRRTIRAGAAGLAFGIVGSIGNIGIPSNFFGSDVDETTRKVGKSTEPFFIFANVDFGYQVAIPEDSSEFTHTLQIYKFVSP